MWNWIEESLVAYFHLWAPFAQFLDYLAQKPQYENYAVVVFLIFVCILFCAGMGIVIPFVWNIVKKLKFGELEVAREVKAFRVLATLSGLFFFGLLNGLLISPIFFKLISQQPFWDDPWFGSGVEIIWGMIFWTGFFNVLTVSMTGLLSPLYYIPLLVFTKIFKLKVPENLWQIIRVLFIFLGIALAMATWRITFNNYRGDTYNTLHAAIKNTCLIDPKKEHCPLVLEDLAIIEPAQYATAVKSTQMFYRYYPDTNQYTFMVRYDKRNAIIFDQRLIPDQGVDLREVEIETFGRDRVIDPPKFAGPWDNLPEWDKF